MNYSPIIDLVSVLDPLCTSAADFIASQIVNGNYYTRIPNSQNVWNLNYNELRPEFITRLLSRVNELTNGTLTCKFISPRDIIRAVVNTNYKYLELSSVNANYKIVLEINYNVVQRVY